jgi:hypothetical protein
MFLVQSQQQRRARLLEATDVRVGGQLHIGQQGAAARGEWHNHFTQKEFLHREDLVGKLQISERGDNK